MTLTELPARLRTLWTNARAALAALPRWERYMTFLWLAGPFVFFSPNANLVEDWLRVIVLVFLGRCIHLSDWAWVRQPWVWLSALFLLVCLVSSAVGFSPVLSVEPTLKWAVFPLYLAAAQVWLGRHPDIRALMLAVCFAALTALCLILLAEVAIEPKTRLTWPYGDMHPGLHLAKTSLLAIVAAAVWAMRWRGTAALAPAALVGAAIAMVILTGERMNAGIVLATAAAALVLSVSTWTHARRLLMFAALVAAIGAGRIDGRADLAERMTTKLVTQIPYHNTDEIYWQVMRGAMQMFTERPWFGYGPNSYRTICPELGDSPLPSVNNCNWTHPHNLTVQIAGETGIFGLLTYLAFTAAVVWACWQARRDEPPESFARFAFIVPLVLLFPLQISGRFFGHPRYNLFLWVGVGFALMYRQGWRSPQSEKL